MDALTDDIERFQTKLPLAALPPAAQYVARKFLQRRWPLVLAVAAFATTVIGFTIRVVNESQRAQSAEKIALSERDRAQIAEQQAVKERDATQAARAEALRERDGAARERDRATNAEQIAEKQRNLALTAEKSALSERDRAKAAERAAVEEKNKATQAELAARQTSDFLVSIFDNSNPNAESGDIPASKLLAAAEEKIEKEMKDQPGTQAELFGAIARVQSNMGNVKRARADHVRAIEIERPLNRPLVLATLLDRMARHFYAYGVASDMAPAAREALALREKFAPPDSAELAESLALMGETLSTLGRRDEAEPMLARAEAILSRSDPNSAAYANVLTAYAAHYRTHRDPAKAADYYLRSALIKKKLYGELHPDYLEASQRHAGMLAALRRFEEAEAELRRVLALREKLHGRNNIKVYDVLVNLGNTIRDAGRPRDAVPVFLEGRDIVVATAGKKSVQYGAVVNNLASAYYFIGDYTSAERMTAESLEILKTVMTQRDGGGLANVHTNLGRLQMRIGKMEEARRNLFTSYDMRVAAYGLKHPDVVDNDINIADWYLRAGQITEASERLDRAKPLLPTPDPLDQIAYDRVRALVDAEQGRIDHAIAALEVTEQTRFKVRGEKSTEAWLGMMGRAELLAKRNRPGDKAASAAIASRILEKISPTFDPAAPVMVRLRQLQREAGAK